VRTPGSSPVLSAPIRVKSLAVYDPSGKGSPDHQRDLSKLLDGNPRTGWSTDSYFEQFPVYKKGLGVMLDFEVPVSAALMTVATPSMGTTLEIRTANSPNARLEQTTLIGTATLKAGTNQIPLRAGQPERYLLIWITSLGGEVGHHQSKLSDLQIQQRAT
jgi:putative peptidoglycan lipid II flippase